MDNQLDGIKFVFSGNRFRLFGSEKHEGTPSGTQPMAIAGIKFVGSRVLNHDFHER
jgi:hypothetical protein